MNRPLNKLKLRGADPTGNGWYGAKRGHREHNGVDYVGDAGVNVYACISGRVRVGRVYADSARAQFRLIEIKTGRESNGTRREVKQMYVSPSVRTGDIVSAGDIIGTLQGIGDYYGGRMPNHCHVELRKNGLLTDPEPLIK